MGATQPDPATPKHRAPTSGWDADTFAQLYDATAARVYGIALQVVADPMQASAVTEQVYLDLWRTGTEGISKTSSALAELVAHAHRLAVVRVRADAGRGDLAERLPVGGAVLSCLPGQQGRAIAQSYFRGRSCAEIADDMGTSVDVVHEQVRQGLVRLRAVGGVAAR
jgi:RNA polymerase sigma-70 factor (ECF subfamily)